MKSPTFLGSKRLKTPQLEKNLAVLGIPTESSCVFRRGTAQAPDAIRRASMQYWYSGFEGLYDPERDKYILTKNELVDLGDITTPRSRKHLEESITTRIKEVLATDSIPICLGGDHSITYPIIRAYQEAMEVIHLDAHTDFQRITDSDAVLCGTVMRKASGLENVKRIIHVGIRGYLNSSQAVRDSQEAGNIIITSKQLKSKGIKEVIRSMNPKIPHYISFDVDFLDPSICPGTTVPEPGGIHFEMAEDLLRSLAHKTKIVGVDCVESNPIYDQNQTSNIYITRLLTSLLGELK